MRSESPRSAKQPVNRVMLIFPPMMDAKLLADTMACPPMGIASLAAYIRDIVDVKLLDCLVEGYWNRVSVNYDVMRVGLDYDDIIARVRKYAPDLVGLSCIFSGQMACVRELARRIKAMAPQTVIVTGGTHPSFLAETVLSSEPALDYIVLGEGELGLRAIIETLNSGTSIAAIDGIAFRDGDKILVNPRTTYIDDLDSLPWPARDLLPMEKYFAIKQPMGLHWRKIRNTPIVSSRGCPYKCAFCSSHLHWGSRFRKRSAENVLAEIEHLRETYNVQELKWQDDNLTADRKRAEAILHGMIDRGLAMPWNTPNGIALWTLDDDMLRLMKKSGCFEITLAVESGDPVSFEKYVGKPFTFEKAKEVARLARKHKITTVAYFIIGFPGETNEQIKRSMQYGLELRVDYLVPFIYNPLPGSELWRECLDKGYIDDNYKYEEANNYYIPGSVINGDAFDTNAALITQSAAYLKNLFKLPFRNPREFISYYGRRVLYAPNFSVNFFRVFWRYRAVIVNGLKKKTRDNPEPFDRNELTDG